MTKNSYHSFPLSIMQENMEEEQNGTNISILWRGKKFFVKMNSAATLKDFGHVLQQLTDVKADTLRLIVPQSSGRGSKLLSPFSDGQSSLSLQETSILESLLYNSGRGDNTAQKLKKELDGKTIRMMGVSEDEVDQVLKSAKVDQRIAGFDEEDRKLRLRMPDGPRMPLKLPQGKYIFCDFRTLHIPGVELNPPASEALRLMHRLAADPGIVAIMNKHQWRVGIMTEMAPVGYVGVSPKCILGFNKNCGEEISLRLRTDDLKGFRKYESIKTTLLHELAHMEHSEHDANFYALDKQLNQEASSLDWTKSRSLTLSGVRSSEYYVDDSYVKNESSFSRKLGGNALDQLANARASSVAAAYRRLAYASAHDSRVSEGLEEPDPDASGFTLDANQNDNLKVENPKHVDQLAEHEPDPDDARTSKDGIASEPDPDDSEMTQVEPLGVASEPDPDDSEMTQVEPLSAAFNRNKMLKEPDPDDSHNVAVEPDPDECHVEPDPDLSSEANRKSMEYESIRRYDQDEAIVCGSSEVHPSHSMPYNEPDPDEPDPDDRGMHAEPDPDDSVHMDVFDPNDQELQVIQDPVMAFCTRLQKAIEMLQAEVNPTEATTVLQTLFKIIRNVIENPNEIKFKRLRKANPTFQKNVANYKAAMEVLFLVGFNEDVVSNETYLVLRRNDPGLLWLAKSSLETCLSY
ncbi:PUB domain [Dillenia turbinata]|uniref:PUB domain n=1 Tax=Dillenia turbinata TaxID=194707 RepID=A0AAN8UYL6_9MAGN